MGLDVFKGTGHPKQVSNESATLLPMPINCASTAALLHRLDAGWQGAVRAGLLVKTVDLESEEDVAIKEARRISNVHFAKLLRSISNAKSQSTNDGKQRARMPAHDSLVKSGTNGARMVSAVKQGRMKAFDPNASQQAAEAALQADSELPPVGSGARVACLSCGRIFESTLREGPERAGRATRVTTHTTPLPTSACRRTLSLGSSAVLVERWTNQQVDTHFKHSKTNLGEAISYDLVLKWLDTMPEDRVLLGEEAITNSLRYFLNNFHEHPQYPTLSRQALTWQHLSSCLSNRLGPDVYIGNARSGYNILGASIHPDQKQTVHRLRPRGLGQKNRLD
ncbi:hypothetical protein OIV83_002986 [Microbotryomycetes sp. JL201]|nr:hypothetical protein OIV83_002986 [Microbotryomycetes sp. JL201]